jgi:hypothetical protein
MSGPDQAGRSRERRRGDLPARQPRNTAMSSSGAAPRAAPVSNARAEASRRNGAKSRGPRTAEGKARSAQNALKHGLRAQQVVLPGEAAAEYAAVEAALIGELAPDGMLQSILVRRIARAAWRLERADRVEVEVLAQQQRDGVASTGLALIRDGNGTRSFETLLRYRGAAAAELMRSLRTLKALQAERARAGLAPAAVLEPPRGGAGAAAPGAARSAARERQPNEPEQRSGRGPTATAEPPRAVGPAVPGRGTDEGRPQGWVTGGSLPGADAALLTSRRPAPGAGELSDRPDPLTCSTMLRWSAMNR